MNKRFFTLMAAVMLAGAPLCNEAFALNNPAVATTAAKLQNGAKFIIENAGSYVKVSDVVNANVTYATLDGTSTSGDKDIPPAGLALELLERNIGVC